jgi:hypothetical protein
MVKWQAQEKNRVGVGLLGGNFTTLQGNGNIKRNAVLNCSVTLLNMQKNKSLHPLNTAVTKPPLRAGQMTG